MLHIYNNQIIISCTTNKYMSFIYSVDNCTELYCWEERSPCYFTVELGTEGGATCQWSRTSNIRGNI